MRDNLIRYLKEYGGRTFREVPFSEVDALVLAELSYLKMKGIVPGFERGEGVSWERMASHPDAALMFADPLYGKQHRRVFELVSASVRYAKVRVNYYREWSDEEREAQFAAVTFFLGETSIFLSFRGTDETLVGWKEDFNMGYMKAVPAQRSALSYLKGVARYTKGRLVLGGHSKGGNLALYAAAYAPGQVQDRIRRIYSFDGPGFPRKFYAQRGFAAVKDRFCKIMPERSVIGMIFANYRDYRVVGSYGIGMVQHDLMQWKIREGRFVYLKELRVGSRRKAMVFNEWIASLSKRQISFFVETLYGLLRSARITNVAQLLRRPLYVLGRIVRSITKMDCGKRRMLLQIIRKLFQAGKRFLWPFRPAGERGKGNGNE